MELAGKVCRRASEVYVDGLRLFFGNNKLCERFRWHQAPKMGESLIMIVNEWHLLEEGKPERGLLVSVDTNDSKEMGFSQLGQVQEDESIVFTGKVGMTCKVEVLTHSVEERIVLSDLVSMGLMLEVRRYVEYNGFVVQYPFISSTPVVVEDRANFLKEHSKAFEQNFFGNWYLRAKLKEGAIIEGVNLNDNVVTEQP